MQQRWNRELLAHMTMGREDRAVMKGEDKFGLFDRLEGYARKTIEAVLVATLLPSTSTDNGSDGIGHGQYQKVLPGYPTDIGAKANKIIFDYTSTVLAKGMRLYAENEAGKLLFAMGGLAMRGGGKLLGEWSWLKRTGSVEGMSFEDFVKVLKDNGIEPEDIRVRSGSNGKLAIMGRNMEDRVIPTAKGLGAETFASWREETAARAAEWDKATIQWNELRAEYPHGIPREEVENSLSFKMNRRWVDHILRGKYTVLDTGSGGATTESFHYEMETENVFRKRK